MGITSSAIFAPRSFTTASRDIISNSPSDPYSQDRLLNIQVADELGNSSDAQIQSQTIFSPRTARQYVPSSLKPVPQIFGTVRRTPDLLSPVNERYLDGQDNIIATPFLRLLSDLLVFLDTDEFKSSRTIYTIGDIVGSLPVPPSPIAVSILKEAVPNLTSNTSFRDYVLSSSGGTGGVRLAVSTEGVITALKRNTSRATTRTGINFVTAMQHLRAYLGTYKVYRRVFTVGVGAGVYEDIVGDNLLIKDSIINSSSNIQVEKVSSVSRAEIPLPNSLTVPSAEEVNVNIDSNIINNSTDPEIVGLRKLRKNLSLHRIDNRGATRWTLNRYGLSGGYNSNDRCIQRFEAGSKNRTFRDFSIPKHNPRRRSYSSSIPNSTMKKIQEASGKVSRDGEYRILYDDSSNKWWLSQDWNASTSTQDGFICVGPNVRKAAYSCQFRSSSATAHGAERKCYKGSFLYYKYALSFSNTGAYNDWHNNLIEEIKVLEQDRFTDFIRDNVVSSAKYGGRRRLTVDIPTGLRRLYTSALKSGNLGLRILYDTELDVDGDISISPNFISPITNNYGDELTAKISIPIYPLDTEFRPSITRGTNMGQCVITWTNPNRSGIDSAILAYRKVSGTGATLSGTHVPINASDPDAEPDPDNAFSTEAGAKNIHTLTGLDANEYYIIAIAVVVDGATSEPIRVRRFIGSNVDADTFADAEDPDPRTPQLVSYAETVHLEYTGTLQSSDIDEDIISVSLDIATTSVANIFIRGGQLYIKNYTDANAYTGIERDTNINGATILRVQQDIPLSDDYYNLLDILDGDRVSIRDIEVIAHRKINIWNGSSYELQHSSNSYRIMEHLLREWGYDATMNSFVSLRYLASTFPADTFDGIFSKYIGRRKMFDTIISSTFASYTPSENGFIITYDGAGLGIGGIDINSDISPSSPASIRQLVIGLSEADYVSKVSTTIDSDRNDGIEVRYVDELSNQNIVKAKGATAIDYDVATDTYIQIDNTLPSNPIKFNLQGLLGIQRALSFASQTLIRNEFRRVHYALSINHKLEVRPNDIIIFHEGYTGASGKVLKLTEVGSAVSVELSFTPNPMHTIFLPRLASIIEPPETEITYNDRKILIANTSIATSIFQVGDDVVSDNIHAFITARVSNVRTRDNITDIQAVNESSEAFQPVIGLVSMDQDFLYWMQRFNTFMRGGTVDNSASPYNTETNSNLYQASWNDIQN